MDRYRKFTKVENDLDFYSKQIKARGKKRIEQYRPRPFGTLPEDVDRQLVKNKRVWTVSTKLYKLADEFYGDMDLWWVIGYYNNKPIDLSWNVGDEIIIPTPVRIILDSLEV
jgi:hypothetical protein